MIRKRTNDRSTNRPHKSKLWQSCKTLFSLKQIHASLIIRGFNSNPSALRELVFAASIIVPGAMAYAQQVFDQIAEPDMFMYNTIMRGSAQGPEPSKAVLVFKKMDSSGVKVDAFTFPFLLKACARLEWPKVGFCVHGKVVKSGFYESRFVRNALIYFHSNVGDLGVAEGIFDARRGSGGDDGDVVACSALTAGYARRGYLEEARRVFDAMPVKDLVSWNVMITAYAKRGEMESARRLFDNVPERDVVTWNAMISGYVLCGENETALSMFEEMRSVGEMPDEVTMISILSACTEMRELEVGRKVHNAVLEMSKGNLNLLVGNALIDMYAKCGSIESAFAVFNGMRDKDVSSWNTLIGGLAFHGHVEPAIRLFEEMQRFRSVTPNEVTFIGLLVACSHAGKVKEGHQYFDLMRYQYNIEPNVRHYGCMVDLLGRAGLLFEAFDFIDQMKVEPNAIIWRTLLGACRVHGNTELGRLANEKLLRLRQDESGDYVLLSNIYASVGKFDGAEKVRKLMDDSGVHKATGTSLVDGEDRVLMKYLLNLKPNTKPIKQTSLA